MHTVYNDVIVGPFLPPTERSTINAALTNLSPDWRLQVTAAGFEKAGVPYLVIEGTLGRCVIAERIDCETNELTGVAIDSRDYPEDADETGALTYVRALDHTPINTANDFMLSHLLWADLHEVEGIVDALVGLMYAYRDRVCPDALALTGAK